MIDRRLQVLRMVAQRGTVTGAAEALSYTPSAVSQQLRTLGRELGVDLLVHDGRGVRLSPAAQVLLDRTDELVSRWEEIRAEVARVAETGRSLADLAAEIRRLPQVLLNVSGVDKDAVDDDDGVLFTSLWGTLTEGVSFDGDDAHTVVVVGVPYPHLDDRLRAVEDAYDAAFDAGWEYAVEIPTIRKTRQALGRVLRSPEEIGVRALLDARYTGRASREMGKYAVRESFPDEERAEIIDIDPEKLKFAMLNFYTDFDAYDGAPPTP